MTCQRGTYYSCQIQSFSKEKEAYPLPKRWVLFVWGEGAPGKGMKRSSTWGTVGDHLLVPGWHGPLLSNAQEKEMSGHDAGCWESRRRLDFSKTWPRSTISSFKGSCPGWKLFLDIGNSVSSILKQSLNPGNNSWEQLQWGRGLNTSKRRESGHPLPLRRFLVENKGNQEKKVKWKSSQLNSQLKEQDDGKEATK